MVNRSGDQFFAGSAFSCEQHGDVAVCHHFHQLVDPLHRFAVPDHLIETHPGFETVSQVFVFRGEDVPLERFVDHDGKTLAINGFGEVVIGPVAHGFDRCIDRAIGRHDHDFRIRPFRFEAANEFDTADPRHFKISQY